MRKVPFCVPNCCTLTYSLCSSSPCVLHILPFFRTVFFIFAGRRREASALHHQARAWLLECCAQASRYILLSFLIPYLALARRAANIPRDRSIPLDASSVNIVVEG